jgi:hypothetical protein
MPEFLGYVHISREKLWDPAKSSVLGTAAEHTSDRDLLVVWLLTDERVVPPL